MISSSAIPCRESSCWIRTYGTRESIELMCTGTVSRVQRLSTLLNYEEVIRPNGENGRHDEWILLSKLIFVSITSFAVLAPRSLHNECVVDRKNNAVQPLSDHIESAFRVERLLQVFNHIVNCCVRHLAPRLGHPYATIPAPRRRFCLRADNSDLTCSGRSGWAAVTS